MNDPSLSPPGPSRAPRRGFFALALLLVLTWVSQFAEREGLRRAALTYDLGAVELAMNVITLVDVILGLGVVVSLLLVCLAPRSARVTVPAQVAATFAALAVLVRGGLRLLLASGGFSASPDLGHYGGIAVGYADLASSALLFVVLLRVTRAAKAHVAFAFAVFGLVLVLATLIAFSLTTFAGEALAMRDVLDRVQFWAATGSSTLSLWLCVHAGVVVMRIPDDFAAEGYSTR